MTSTTKLYNGKHIQDFAHFYRNTAAKYIVDNGFILELEYMKDDIYKVKPSGESGKLSIFNSKSNSTLESEIRNKINIDVLNNQNLYWSKYLNDFYRHLYLNASEIDRTIMQKEGFLVQTLLDVCQALEKHPKELEDFVKNSYKENGYIINSPFHLQSAMEILQQNLPQDNFSNLVLDFFTINKQIAEKPKNLVSVNYVFKQIVQDEETYQKLINLFMPKQESSIFVDDNIHIYEVVVSRQILSQQITLPEKDYYNHMNTDIVELFNNNAEKLNLIEVSLPIKFKSAKEFRFLVKTKPESTYTKEKFKKSLMSIYTDYENFASSVKHSFEIKDYLTNEWFMKCVLSGLVPEKENTPIMRKKI